MNSNSVQKNAYQQGYEDRQVSTKNSSVVTAPTSSKITKFVVDNGIPHAAGIAGAVGGGLIGGAIVPVAGAPAGAILGYIGGAATTYIVAYVLDAVRKYAPRVVQSISNWFASKGYRNNDVVKNTDVKAMSEQIDSRARKTVLEHALAAQG